MSEDVKLPTTVEEFHRELRDAYRAGAYSRSAWRNPEVEKAVEAEARRLYPIRKKVPREVRFFWHDRPATVVDQHSEPKVKVPEGATHFTARELDVLRDLLANPFEEVEE